ncbi:MAG: YegS/Rv2252/BmrU family lipid kinase [Pygmaiobacter sp.]
MKKKLLLLYNPTSGRAQIGKRLDEILDVFFDADYEVTIYAIRPGYGAEEILRDRGEDFDLVVCCGGDGTLHHTVNGLMQLAKRPVLGYLPSGSTNDFASNLGLGKDLLEDCNIITHGVPFTYDIGLFHENRYFNYVAAIGAFTDVSYSTPQETKNALGYFAYIIEGIKRLPFNTKYHAKITLDTETIEDDYLYAAISNSFSVGGMDLSGHAQIHLDDGLFELLLIKAPQNILDLQVILGKLMTRDFSGPLVRLLHTTAVNFEFDTAVPWTLDGEFGGAWQNCSISIVQKAIAILCPPLH